MRKPVYSDLKAYDGTQSQRRIEVVVVKFIQIGQHLRLHEQEDRGNNEEEGGRSGARVVYVVVETGDDNKYYDVERASEEPYRLHE